ncbi:triphosphoribosyl-dephospho-CoA synthase CitG [Enterocloster clostridioformis]|uniref:triphosphoribosyl-dephospho-CoA synthase CitG n=1 Tax=Enterocloster clostridioformis TaxID=1531 RepID=UPI0004252FFB|nr:triphosphoribosyl-dephospho-CoA synthase CitG [Enterocloster clostridioformis]
MTGKEVSLMEMLDARELRVHRQLSLQQKYASVLICFTMNIAGPVKNNRLIYRAFEYGCDILRHQLVSAGIECLHQECYSENTGNVCYYCVKGNAVEIKKITVEIENNLSVGRLFDMDVLDENGNHIERMEIGESPRTCLLCGNPAKECARNRTHSVAELEQTTKELLLKEFQEQDSRKIAELACRSLLYEVCTTPKPGLVDRRNSGSHKDMDCFTFMSSTVSLWPYFQKCAQMGMETAQEPPKETFRRLRWAGKIAGYDMNQATNGVNTHKGALFSIGILCGALGRLPREKWKNVKVVLGECAAMTKGIVEHDFRGVTEENAGTTGEKLYVKYGITGIRGQAEKGFPAVMEAGLPALERGLKKGLSLEQAGCIALLALMVSTVDTNLIARSNRETQLQVTEEIKEILERNPYPEEDMLEILDRAFISKNLSPGGSADLLAFTYFLYFLKEQ